MEEIVATFSDSSVDDSVKLECVDAAVLPSAVVQGRQNPLHFGLAVRLRKARKAACLSFDSIADAAGLTNGSTVFELESKAVHHPRLDTLEKIAYALRLSPAFLAYGIGGTCSPRKSLRAHGVGARLQETRLARGLSALALAQVAGASHTSVGNIERGRTMPTIATVEALAKALSVSPGWLGYGLEPQTLPSRRGARAAQASAD